MIDVTDERFEQLVDAAFAQVPEKFLDNMRNLVVLIEDYNPDSVYTLGLFHGVPLPQQTFNQSTLPNSITIYREALQNYCHSEEHLVEQLRITVMHEIGHYFGLSEEDLHRLGYA